MTVRVPFSDLISLHAGIKDEICNSISDVIDTAEFVGGSYVEQFENEFSEYCNTAHAICVGSGTDAIWLTLTAMGVGPGDEVITVPMSFIATAEAISNTGARPVFVDIEECTYTMDASALDGALTRNTKAIVPVQLFGQAADMNPILEFADKHGLMVVEDAAQCHGAKYGGSKVGSLGNAGCFSFYPGKNLGAIGEAGAVVTNDGLLAERIRILRDHGQFKKNQHSVIGWNSRMDGIQGAVLSIKLRHLDEWNRMRQEIATTYSRELSGYKNIILPRTGTDRSHVFHIYAIRALPRDEMTLAFDNRKIGYGIHYPVPIHLQKAYAHLGLKEGSYPVSEACANTFLSLPMYPEMTQVQLKWVIDTIGIAQQSN